MKPSYTHLPTKVANESPITFLNAIQNFFFLPAPAYSLAIIRIATGSMIAYIHFIWMLNLEAFMGPFALINNATWQSLHQGSTPDFKWTYLAHTESMPFIWCHEIFACMAGILLAMGFLTRTMSILAWFTTLMAAHRMTGMLFGLDQITLMLSMYLCLARPGSVWSFDHWHAAKSSFATPSWFVSLSGFSQCSSGPAYCWSNTFATRLIQLHLCVIYLFGGLGKLRGEMWWDGSAVWYSIASYDYQSLDMTWTGHFPMLSSMATHLTLFWEVSYCAVVWPRWTRPWALLIALIVHAGIALFLGMITFCFMMIIANIAFISPTFIRNLVGMMSKNYEQE